MAHVFGRLAFFFVSLLGLLFSSSVLADDCADQLARIEDSCQQGVVVSMASGLYESASCVRSRESNGGTKVSLHTVKKAQFGGDVNDESYGSSCVPYVPPPPPSTGCAAAPPMTGAFAGNLASGASMCSPQGNGVSCTMTFTPDGPPFMNRAGTAWATHGSYAPTGGGCISQGENAPPPPAPAKSCGGQSCYDSAKDSYCATDASGAQICVPGKSARAPSGSCASGGNTTVCAGTPQPPKPPAPPASPISDPPTETRGTDSYPQSSNGAAGTSAGGGNYTTNVTTYGAGTSAPGSGQVSGDDGPAHSSSSGGSGDDDGKDDTSASGGGDCNNAPSVEGNAALAMIATQTWRVRCAIEGDKSDDSDKSIPGLDAIPEGTTSAESPIHEVSQLGAEKLDSTGFLGGSNVCPRFPGLDFEFLGWGVHYAGPPTGWCKLIEVLGIMVMVMASVYSYIILMGK